MSQVGGKLIQPMVARCLPWVQTERGDNEVRVGFGQQRYFGPIFWRCSINYAASDTLGKHGLDEFISNIIKAWILEVIMSVLHSGLVPLKPVPEIAR